MIADCVNVMHSVVSPAALRAVLNEAYGVAPGGSCRLIHLGKNDTYLWEGERFRYIVRIYHAGWRTSADILYELDLLEHLQAQGVSVSTAVRDQAGHRVRILAAPEGQRALVVFRYAQGQQLDWQNHEQCDRAGRVLADIHSVSRAFRTGHRRFPLDLAYLIDDPLRRLRRFLQNQPAERDYLESFGARLRERIAGVAGQLTPAICHGGFGSVNLHVDQDGGLTVIDFDDCGPGWITYDFAMFRRAAALADDHFVWQRFLAAYRARAALQDIDLEMIPFFRAGIQLQRLGQRARFSVEFEPLTQCKIERRIRSFRRWEASLPGSGGAGRAVPDRRLTELAAGPSPVAAVGSPATGIPSHPIPAQDIAESPLPVPVEVASSTVAPEAIADQVRARHRLAEPIVVRLEQRGEIDLYRLQAGRASYRVRVFPACSAMTGRLEQELGLADSPAGHQAPVEAPIPDREDRRWWRLRAPEGDRVAGLFRDAEVAAE